MTYDQVRHDIDLPRLEALNKYWRVSPPVHVLVKWFMNYEPPKIVPKEDVASQFLANISLDGLPNGGF